MKTHFLVGFYLVLALFVTGALADEVIDSGWVEIKPSELVKGLEGPSLDFHGTGFA
jgi:predicted DNA-binding transcriptional regulator